MNDDVRAELDALPDDIGASFLRIAEMIQTLGLERMREPYVTHLEGPLWEMRMEGQGRHRPRRLRYRRGPPRDRRACVPEEDAEDAASGDQNGP